MLVTACNVPVDNTARVLLIYKPLLSTRMRSHAPAPINTVHWQVAAAGIVPIIVLLLPVVTALPAQKPTKILLRPVVFPLPAQVPIAVLLSVLQVEINAPDPTATLLVPVLRDCSVPYPPMATLLLPL